MTALRPARKPNITQHAGEKGGLKIDYCKMRDAFIFCIAVNA